MYIPGTKKELIDLLMEYSDKHNKQWNKNDFKKMKKKQLYAIYFQLRKQRNK